MDYAKSQQWPRIPHRRRISSYRTYICLCSCTSRWRTLRYIRPDISTARNRPTVHSLRADSATLSSASHTHSDATPLICNFVQVDYRRAPARLGWPRANMLWSPPLQSPSSVMSRYEDFAVMVTTAYSREVSNPAVACSTGNSNSKSNLVIYIAPGKCHC